MSSVRVTGQDWLPEQVNRQTYSAVAIGLAAGCKHLQETGHFCPRVQIELSTPPDSSLRAAIEQEDKISELQGHLLMVAESEAWDLLRQLSNDEINVGGV